MAKYQATRSGYERMQDILNAAAGDSSADYQGYGKFWMLPVDQLQKVIIYGVQMIAPIPPEIECNTFGGSVPATAPVAEKSCCCSTKDSIPPEQPAGMVAIHKYPGRGEKSGLIIALRGNPPFDDTQFTPFMWGGSRVDPSDIQFISDWIDDGCPTTPEQGDPLLQKAANTAAALSLSIRMGEQRALVATRSVNSIKSEAGQPHQRKNAECLSEDELCKLRYAFGYVQELSTKYPLDNRGYETYARLHGNECQHGWEQFLPWHRMMLYDFEKQLQDFVPDVALVYWDWPMSIYNKGMLPKAADIKMPKGIKAQIPDKYISGIIPTPYKCFLNEAAIGRLVAQGVPATIKPIQGFSYNSGAEFIWVVAQLIGDDAAKNFKQVIFQELKKVNPIWHDLRYPGMFYDPKTGQPQGGSGITMQFHHHYPEQSDLDLILQQNNWRDFGGGPDIDNSFGVLDQEPHNTIHLWVGGENPDNYNGADQNPLNPPVGSMLGNLTAAYDPIFYAHHANVDRQFALWQQRWPGQTAFDPNAQLAGLDYVVADAWDMAQLGYEYVMDSKYFETQSNTGFKMMRTEKAGIHAKAMAQHKKAVLTLHKVLPAKRSFSLRIFVNQPDANESTPIVNNEHYAGFVSFFGHGDCIGGPGHCEMPAPQRLFDKRQTAHSRPANYRVNITDAVQRMKAKGNDDIEIKLVAVNTGHLGVDDMLRFEGLSLNFY